MKAFACVAVGAVFVFAQAGAPIVRAAAASPAAASDDLQLMNSTQLRRVYLAPGADLRRFNRVILEPTEVAFSDTWVRDFNRGRRSGRLTDRDAQRIKDDFSQGMGDAFSRAFRNAGYQIVDAPGPDVLRVHTKVANLSMTAPTVQGSPRTRTFAENAGEATLILEARDSGNHELLGRALDRRIAGRSRVSMRNSVTNRADFQRVFQTWASAGVEDLAALKAASPVGR